MKLPNLQKCNITIIGLGYVGLPLAVEIAKTKLCKKTGKKLARKIVGFDLNMQRLEDLRNGIDKTKEFSQDDLQDLNIIYTNDEKMLFDTDVFIITVPTPIDESKEPDLTALIKATETVGRLLFSRDSDIGPIIIYESTVFPGATEEVCIPRLEKISKKKINIDFCCGYSPERINPGDKVFVLDNIVKVTSGSNSKSAKFINQFYSSIIKAGTFPAESIKVAEAAKVIENTQRDINIALVNEFSIIFNKMNIDTIDVLNTAASKWNFLNFRPGLVGGHCIGIDPYYLTWKSKQIGYQPKVVLAGRETNEKMHEYIFKSIEEKAFKFGIDLNTSNILIMGFTFKENCPDIRNSKVKNLVDYLINKKLKFSIYDPVADIKEISSFLKKYFLKKIDYKIKYQFILLLVPHEEFLNLTKISYENLLKENGYIYDLKGVLKKNNYIIRP